MKQATFQPRDPVTKTMSCVCPFVTLFFVPHSKPRRDIAQRLSAGLVIGMSWVRSPRAGAAGDFEFVD